MASLHATRKSAKVAEGADTQFYLVGNEKMKNEVQKGIGFKSNKRSTPKRFSMIGGFPITEK